MTGNMLDYLQEFGDVPFTKREFGDADAILLCQLVYCKFDGLIMGDDPVYMKDLLNDPQLDGLFSDPKYERDNKNLFARMVMGRRYRNLQLSEYVNIVDKETETQFCAVTFTLPGGVNFIAFRGTDENLIGWKEDINLSFMDEVPGQRHSLTYLNEAASRINGKFYVGGHSKGGHLAIYSAMHAPESLQKRIINVYCMDGPGFMEKMFYREGYDRIRDVIVKLIPQSSLIGLMQERDNAYKVVRSNTWGLHQHNMYTWIIRDGEPEPDVLRDGARFAANTINEWMLQQDTEHREQSAAVIYNVLNSSEADNRVDFMSNFASNAGQVLTAFRDLDPEAADMLRELLGSLMSDAKQNFLADMETEVAAPVQEWIDKHFPGWIDRLKKK